MSVVYNYAVIIADMDYLHSAVDAHMRKRLAHFFNGYAHLAQERDGRKDIVDAEKPRHTDLCVPRGIKLALAVELYSEEARAAQRIYILCVVIALFVESVAYHLAF